MKTLSVIEIEKLLNKEPFNVIRLVDSTGGVVVPWNNPNVKVGQRKAEILKKLKSTILPDGLYYLEYRETMNNTESKRYPVQKGRIGMISESVQPEPSPKVVEKVVVKTMSESERVLTWESALQMQQTIATLTARVAELERENAELLDELEGDEEDGLQENSAETLSTLEKFFEKTVPVLDKYFEQKDREISVMEQLGKVAPIKNPVVAHPKTSPAPSPVPSPTTQPYQTIITTAPVPGAGGVPTQPGAEDQRTQEDDQLILSLSYDELENIYSELKRTANLVELRKFLRIMRELRPGDLQNIVSRDMQDINNPGSGSGQ
jgi:hypothetical protein